MSRTRPASNTPVPFQRASEARYFTLAINLEDVPCVVVGGGPVGARKTLSLTAAGARVTVVAPEICNRLAPVVDSGQAAWVRRVYDVADLQSARLVVAATSDQRLNLQIGADAEARGIFSCVASSASHSRVLFPAVHRGNQVCLAVHTDGRNCHLARRTRDALAEWLRELDSARSGA